MSSNYYLIDLERSIGSGGVHYWKANRRGYTTDLNEAGLYSDLTAKEIEDGDFDRLTVKVEQERAERLFDDHQQQKETMSRAVLKLKDKGGIDIYEGKPEMLLAALFQEYKGAKQEVEIERQEDGFSMKIPDNGVFEKLQGKVENEKVQKAMDEVLEEYKEMYKSLKDK